VREILSLMFPLAAMTLGIGVAFWAIYWSYQTKQLQYQERRLMIEKGIAPPSAQPSEEARLTAEDYLSRGVIMIFLAVGLAIASSFLGGRGADGPPAWLLQVAAAIVGLLGLGSLVYYVIARNRKPTGTMQ
jgi:hypothetical protein